MPLSESHTSRTLHTATALCCVCLKKRNEPLVNGPPRCDRSSLLNTLDTAVKVSRTTDLRTSLHAHSRSRI